MKDIIKKQEELIEYLSNFVGIGSIAHKIMLKKKQELSVLKSKMAEVEISDEDIKNYCINRVNETIIPDLALIHVVLPICIECAKAHRDNLIKKG